MQSIIRCSTHVTSHQDPTLEYVLLELLGEGRQAEVYYAKKREKKTEKSEGKTIARVAIRSVSRKLFVNENEEISFLREQIAIENIKSQYVIKKFETIKTANHFYSVIEYANGKTLLDLI